MSLPENFVSYEEVIAWAARHLEEFDAINFFTASGLAWLMLATTFDMEEYDLQPDASHMGWLLVKRDAA